jgi:hypothetical protein
MKKNINLHIKHKVLILFLLIFLFTSLYMLFDDTNFGGISNLQELIKEELIKNKIKEQITEKYYNYDEELTNIDIELNKDDERAINVKTKELKDTVKKSDLKEEKIKPNLLSRFFNRLYFSVITGTTLGYGDIYPITTQVKIITMIQSFMTIVLIIN